MARNSQLPYHLRTGKFVDRRLFIDALQRLKHWSPHSCPGYFSMGAWSLADHVDVYRMLGLNRLMTFDDDVAVVARAEFNRPIENMLCVKAEASAFADDFDRYRKAVCDEGSAIIWLDYTTAYNADRAGEVRAMLSSLKTGDVLRVTVNAKTGSYLPPKTETRKQKVEALLDAVGGIFEEVRHDDTRHDALAALGLDGSPESLNRFSAASLLIKSILSLGSDVFSNSDVQVEPICLTEYSDGAKMASATIIIRERSDESWRNLIGPKVWDFAYDKNEVRKLKVPPLTLREQLSLERMSGSKCDASEVQKALGFSKIDGGYVKEVYEQYKSTSRYHPIFVPGAG